MALTILKIPLAKKASGIKRLYTNPKKKRPLYSYVCLFQMNAAILFSYFASITLII